ncbi:hypothetical protein [uncultured Cohaesibacter sp.]|uniref:hypothetical protein n=1 Tax=uncultured Cohaesibacter sp. TaxID=1002546 RepID=UPI0029C6F60A|nr:hypothetical protein [uncultured Cohaesibacter sp.]
MVNWCVALDDETDAGTDDGKQEGDDDAHENRMPATDFSMFRAAMSMPTNAQDGSGLVLYWCEAGDPASPPVE